MSFSNSDMIDPSLSIEQQELLICLADEAEKISQTIAKILRYGYTSYNPFTTTRSNSEQLLQETGDFLGVVDRLVDLELFSADALAEQSDRKLARLEDYLLFKGDEVEYYGE